MNKNHELWMLIKSDLDFFSKLIIGKTSEHAPIDSNIKQVLWARIEGISARSSTEMGKMSSCWL